LTVAIKGRIAVYIGESMARQYTLFDVPVYFKDKFALPIDLEYVLQKIEAAVPSEFLYGIDSIMVGEFEDFKERSINAKLEDGAIYVSHEQDDEDDLIDDLVHEIAHNVEDLHGDTLYSDDSIEVEFLGKRKRLYSLLKGEHGANVIPWLASFLQSGYNRRFDDFLFKVVGYPLLTSLTMGLYTSPYGATSLREYFATTFEEYFLKDAEHVKYTSPAVYTKLRELTRGEDKSYD